MRSNGRILYFSAGIVLIVLLMGGVSYAMFGRLRTMLDDQFSRSEIDRQDAAIAVQAREIHLALYKAPGGGVSS